MANNYFDFLDQNSQQEQPANNTPTNDGSVNLTARADADCQVVCDGDFLFLLNANQIAKEKAPVGQHILEFVSIDHPEISVEKIVDFPEPGKNYLVVVNELSKLISDSQSAQTKHEVPAPISEMENKYFFVFYRNPAIDIALGGVFPDEMAAQAFINKNQGSYLDWTIKEFNVPAKWDQFFIFGTIDDVYMPSICICASSNDGSELRRQWMSGLGAGYYALYKGVSSEDALYVTPSQTKHFFLRVNI